MADLLYFVDDTLLFIEVCGRTNRPPVEWEAVKHLEIKFFRQIKHVLWPIEDKNRVGVKFLDQQKIFFNLFSRRIRIAFVRPVPDLQGP